MSPSNTRDSPVSQPSSRDRHKMRKPAVEKLRRDRINGCIEQLKVLLEEEFHKRDPNAKLEKADVLEMTVGFLKRRLRPQGALDHAAARGDGYSRCWEETLHFLSAGSPEEVTSQRLRYTQVAPALPSSHGHVQSAAKHPPATPGTEREVWRPW
ncbi:transcription factor HES-5-like [Anoplopoma fimbria]|uniref:transcription factor HES-5-like n=1 Tax=Anoplopoma fimbria TaxID=229290 RepID=UPI0023EB3E76|nr:transcription factor HES-5-like [Anoplopoma fimbria]